MEVLDFIFFDPGLVLFHFIGPLVVIFFLFPVLDVGIGVGIGVDWLPLVGAVDPFFAAPFFAGTFLATTFLAATPLFTG